MVCCLPDRTSMDVERKAREATEKKARELGQAAGHFQDGASQSTISPEAVVQHDLQTVIRGDEIIDLVDPDQRCSW